ncbi:polysaccharide pyruvyl transferase family protein [Clostridium sp.]|uniref:polysaccharide pyruvyl transferase family protein n=1 Tax=Clostridium sp. TaxID=1506 RepID=UPI0029114091|nr:polysaccharide pyruvyl transferase family protein [Clostridium sp.]MDU3411316.1 polysaccharide pyruvyl transferase family protein [Clostridium sp.]
MRNKTFLILPGCDDSNRGDQALIWETVRVAKDAGFQGKYYMVATENCARQSQKLGIQQMDYVLPHPSENVSDNDNIEYGLKLKIKWIKASIGDLCLSVLLLNKNIRKIAEKLLDEKKKRTIELFKGAEAAFVKGGGFLHSYGGIVDSYKIFFFLYHIKLALAFDIPVYIMPNSFGPFKGIFVKRLMKNTLNKCQFVSSRESVSRDVLYKECGVDSYLTNDLAMYLQKDLKFDARKNLVDNGVPIGKKKCVAITLRPYRFSGQKNADILYDNYKNAFVHFVEWLSNHDYHVTFIEHVFSESYHEQDMICIKEVIDLLPGKIQYSVFSDLTLNCRQLKSIYGCFDYIIGTRFHSVIFSLMEGVPAIAITYGGNKGVGIMKDSGLMEYSIDISSITSKKLVKSFESMVTNEDDIKKILSNLITKSLEDRTDLIKEMIKGK